MKKVLAALDNSLAGKSLLAAASTFATLLGAEVEALHVRTDGERTARNAAEAAGIRLRATTGPVVERLYASLRKISSPSIGVFRQYLSALRSVESSLGPSDRFLVRRIEGLESLAVLK